ncbi:MAG TPA: hypothetical protein VFG33_27080 [Kribbella sp.]|uniref:hypothetical protein n=1 Tax=Kribbella sp. TaxID=1871183 RepID=UPI002D7652E0|nr:hypothetical protein [Kribbella sp.]HET6297079.1 hypothetical protein [Kribbella sp.]
MGDTCEICGRPAVDSFSLLWRFGERPDDIGEALQYVGERTAGFCAEHEVAVRARLRDDGWLALRSQPLQNQNFLTPQEERERAAREKQAELDRQERQAAVEAARQAWEAGRPEREREDEVRYQRALTEYKRRFERGLTKRTRIAAARRLSEHTDQRDPAEAARAYEYILANRPPEQRDQLFELGTRLRVVGSLEAAEQVFRKLRDEDHGDEESLFGLIHVLRKLDRGDEADALVRWHERLLALRDLLGQAVIRAKQYHVGGRVERIAPAVLDLLEPDEEASRASWSMSLPIARGIGYAVLTDRRLLVVQDYEYLDSGVQRGRAAEHASFALDSELAQQQFPTR